MKNLLSLPLTREKKETLRVALSNNGANFFSTTVKMQSVNMETNNRKVWYVIVGIFGVNLTYYTMIHSNGFTPKKVRVKAYYSHATPRK